MNICIYKRLHDVAFRGQLRRGADEAVEPSFYQFDLVAVMNGRGAECGRIKSGFFDYNGSAGVSTATYVRKLSTNIRSSGLDTGSMLSDGCSSAMLPASLLAKAIEMGIYKKTRRL